MKSFLLFVPCLLFFCETKSQYSRIVIQLKDKGSNTFSLSAPIQYLSSKAVQRRTKYSIPLDSTDLPVTKKYIDSIKAVPNVNVLSISKWLNRVLIKTTDPAAITKIQSFPFVASVMNSAPRMPIPIRNKFKEIVEPLNKIPQRNQQTLTDVLSYGNNYNQVHIHEGEFLHNKGFTGSNMQVTVLDAGFYHYQTITAFDSVRLNGQVLGERDFVDFDGSVNEDDTHGMYCLSIMAANWPGQMIGTAPKAKFWLVRTENAPNEYPVEELNWVVGAEFADSTGSDLISSSLGYNTFDDGAFDHNYSQLYKNQATVTMGAALATKKGMIVMSSAGNEGNNSWKYIVFPADADSVCTVGAVNSQGTIASFSSRGYPGKLKPNIVSVGVGTVIAGQNNLPSSGNGTSFSNPNLAGLVTCLWQAFPALNNMQILDAVYKSASQYASPDTSYGYGIPNFKTAYRIIKHNQNVALYGNEWLWATPDPFDSIINVKFIGRRDGSATIYLRNAAGQVLKSRSFITEPEETYNFSFDTLSYLPAGFYKVDYTDSAFNTNSVTLHKGSIFPLRLISFSGIIADNRAQLQWTTEDEMSIKNYELQRSVDRTNFATINTTSPFYSASKNNYQYLDANPLIEGYYRLKLINFDGSITYSNTVLLKLSNSQLILKYDLLTTVVNIKSVRPVSDKLQVGIFSSDGKRIMKSEKNLPAGINEMNISLSGFPEGIYIVNAENGAGRKTIKVKK